MTSKTLTKNQKIVLDALRVGNAPMSAYQILDQEDVRSNGLKAPLTIYRALDKLVEAGLVHRIESLNAFILCDQDHHTDPPAFMICHNCKNITEVGTRAVRNALKKQASELGFRIEQLQVEASGRCRRCAID